MRTAILVSMALLSVSVPPRHDAAAAAPVRTAVATANPLWEPPTGPRDLFYGPWGEQSAPDPGAVYTFVDHKHHGTNPGVVVRDSRGRVWHVKQAPSNNHGDEGPVEVTLSRLLSAAGYHQPPVYYLPSFVILDKHGAHAEPGGRFRLSGHSLHSVGNWSWNDKTIRSTRPYKGLLAILLAFGSWDLKDDNNEIYEVHRGGGVQRWYVVRDLGGALGERGRFFVKRNDVDEFEREKYIDGLRHGFVHFAYDGKRPELVRHHITADDLRWATGLLMDLTDQDWRDAFRAGGYSADVSDRFIRKIHDNLFDAQRVAGPALPLAQRGW